MAEKPTCSNSRLTCIGLISGSVLTILVLFWAAQQSAIGRVDDRLRMVESKQATVIANQATVIANQTGLRSDVGTVQTTQAKMEGKLDILLMGMKRLEEAKDTRRADATP